jgi:hypothetical protein
MEILIMAENPAGKSDQPGRMPGRPIGTVRVDIARQDKKTFEATYKTEEKTFQLTIDEPEVRGGKGLGPTPLGYFVTGGVVPDDAVRQRFERETHAGGQHQDGRAGTQ